MAAATATKTTRLTTTIIDITCRAILPFHLAAYQSTLLIDKFVATIGALDLTARADAFCAFRRQVGLGFRNIIGQSLAHWVIGENPLAMVTGESPTGHARDCSDR
jgi:hypothetical protein